MTARLRELAEQWKAPTIGTDWAACHARAIRHICAAELLSILDAEGDDGAVGGECSEVWIVQDENGDPIHCAGWPEACQEHINDAINEHGIEEAKSWKVLHYTNGANSASRISLLDDAYVDRLWNAMGQAHPTKSSLRAALAFLSPSTRPARSDGVSDADVEDAAVAYSKRATDGSQDVNFHDCIRAALTHFAKGERHE